MTKLANARLWFVHTPDGEWFISTAAPHVIDHDADEVVGGMWFSKGFLATPSSEAVGHIAHEMGLPMDRGRVHVVEVQQLNTAANYGLGETA